MHKPVVAVSLALLIQACSMLSATAQNVGDRILANPMSMPGDQNYFPGTVLKKNQDGSIVVRLDLREDHTDGEIFNVQKKWTKPGSGQRPANWAETTESDRTFYGIPAQDKLEQQAGGGANNGGGQTNNPGANPGAQVNTGGQAKAKVGGTTFGNGGGISSVPGAGGFFKAGDRVMADPTSMGTHYAATILKALDGGRGGYVINLDKPFTPVSGTTFQIPTKNVKAGNVGAGPANHDPLDKVRATRYGVDPNMYGQAPVNNTPANTNNKVAQDPGKPVQGKGTPPDGIYDCNKISGSSYIHIGTIEIKGNTYRAFAESGPFHPYTMDGAGGITWTGGFSDMPDGWTIGKGNFNGLDHTGKPWIQIRYVSNRNAHETVDAILR